MFTRFQTDSRVHIFDAPLLKFPPQAAGAAFLSTLGEAYEAEEVLHRLWLIRNANELMATLECDEFRAQAGVPKFLAALSGLIEFLRSVPEETVAVYSSDENLSR